LDNDASSDVTAPAATLKEVGEEVVALQLPLPKKECKGKACVAGQRSRRRPRTGSSKLLVVNFILWPVVIGTMRREEKGEH